MKIDPLPRMRTNGPDICFVIIGEGKNAGCIKSVRYGSGVNSDLISISTDYGEDGKPYHELHCSPKYAAKGWRLLYDQFVAEDGDDSRYFDFVNFHNSAVRGRVRVDAEGCNIVPGLPDYMLPQYCRDLHESAADPNNGMWQPPESPKKEKVSGRSRKAELA